MNPSELTASLRDINLINTDIKSEVLAACLSENESVDVTIVPSIRQSGEKDIIEIERQFVRDQAKEFIFIKSNQVSIGKMLPEGLFHKNLSVNNEVRTIVEEIKKSRREEEDAKRFFTPFEALINDYKVVISAYGLGFNSEFHNQFIELLSKWFPVIKLLSTQQLSSFIKMLTMGPILKNAIKNIEVGLAILLNSKVTIDSKLSFNEIVFNNVNSLNQCVLGVNSVLGKNFLHPDYKYIIKIGPIEQDKIFYFKKEGVGGQIIEWMIEWLFESEAIVHVELITSTPNCALNEFYLGINDLVN